MKETELAAPIIEYLAAFHWDVYQEVPVYGGIADIFAVLDSRVWIIELKKTLSLQLLDQAVKRYARAHYISIGIPATKPYPEIKSLAVRAVLERYGIGVLMVDEKQKVIEARGPKLNRDIFDFVLKESLKGLHPKMKKNRAGSKPGNNWTPWKEWKADVQRVVAANPGITPKEMVDRLKTLAPYRKPENAMHAAVYYVRNGLIEGVEVVTDNRRLRLYPAAPRPRGKGMWR